MTSSLSPSLPHSFAPSFSYLSTPCVTPSRTAHFDNTHSRLEPRGSRCDPCSRAAPRCACTPVLIAHSRLLLPQDSFHCSSATSRQRRGLTFCMQRVGSRRCSIKAAWLQPFRWLTDTVVGPSDYAYTHVCFMPPHTHVHRHDCGLGGAPDGKCPWVIRVLARRAVAKRMEGRNNLSAGLGKCSAPQGVWVRCVIHPDVAALPPCGTCLTCGSARGRWRAAGPAAGVAQATPACRQPFPHHPSAELTVTMKLLALLVCLMLVSR